MTPLAIVDGHNLLWRAAYGFPARIHNPAGRDVTAVFGFFALLRVAQRLLGSQAEWIVCFDGEYGSDDRRVLSTAYKAQRMIKADAPLWALPYLKSGLEHAAVAWAEDPAQEADDMIASLCAANGVVRKVIVSTDKDFYQLLSPAVDILNTSRRARARVITASTVQERYGVRPSQWCEYRALVGDPADGIRGVTGVGPKTAMRLLADGRSLDARPLPSGCPARLAATLETEAQSIETARRLMTMRHDLQVDVIITGNPTPPMPRAADVVKAVGLW